MLHEQRAHLALMNLIGEQCAQFRSGTLAMMRAAGAEAVIATVERVPCPPPGCCGRGLVPGYAGRDRVGRVAAAVRERRARWHGWRRDPRP